MAELKIADGIADGKCLNNNDIVSPETLISVIIPDQLILDCILPRLSVKTLIRFKSVSKIWFSTISSPEFAKTHLKISSLNSPNQFILLDISFKFILLPYDELNNLKKPVEMDYTPYISVQKSHTIEFAGCCNGLICLHICYTLDECGFFCICNPALHQYAKICYPDSVKFVTSCWFGYAHSIDDYKIVVRVLSERMNESVHMFSLRTGKWKKIFDTDHCSYHKCVCHMTMPVNDVLYWSFHCLQTLELPKCIVGLDLVDEQLKQFPRMDCLNGFYSASLCMINGCLALLSYSCDSLTDVWILKQYDDWSSWVKLCTIDRGNSSILNVTPTGKFLVLDFTRMLLKIIDQRENTEDEPDVDVYYPNAAMATGAGCYIESLISPFGAIKSA